MERQDADLPQRFVVIPEAEGEDERMLLDTEGGTVYARSVCLGHEKEVAHSFGEWSDDQTLAEEHAGCSPAEP